MPNLHQPSPNAEGPNLEKWGLEPMNRKAGLKRKTRLRAKGRSRFPAKRDPEYAEWVRGLWCQVPGCDDGRTEAAHVQSRGAGGGDRSNLVALCPRHHREQHRIGIKTFAVQCGLDLPLLARENDCCYAEETGR